MTLRESNIPLAPATELPARRTWTVGAALASGRAYDLIESALRDPAQHAERNVLEPMECWQTRAVMAALGKEFIA